MESSEVVDKSRQQSAQPIQKGRFSKFEGIIVSRERVFDVLATLITAIFTVVLALSTVLLWKETKDLRNFAEQQSKDMRDSISEATRAADAMRDVAKVLARRVVNLVSGHFSDEISELRGHLAGELLRILISSAVALRIAFNQYPEFEKLKKTDCGKLYQNWPKQKRKPTILTLCEACNKIIHAKKLHHDIVEPSPGRNPDQEYLQPYLYLYGKKNEQDWRAELSIINFVKWGAVVFLRMAGR